MTQHYNQSSYQKIIFGAIFLFFTFAQTSYAQQIDISLQNNGCQIATYEFTATNVATLHPTADNIDWIFGNGNSSDNTGLAIVPSASYNSSGTYFVTARIQNGTTTLDTWTREIYVFRNATPEFSSDTQTDCYPLTVEFEDLTDLSNTLVGDVIERRWVFGDGNSITFTTASEGTSDLNSVRRDIEHTYANVGDFQVTLVLKTKSDIAAGVGVPTCTGTLVKQRYVKVRHPIEPKASLILPLKMNRLSLTYLRLTPD